MSRVHVHVYHRLDVVDGSVDLRGETVVVLLDKIVGQLSQGVQIASIQLSHDVNRSENDFFTSIDKKKRILLTDPSNRCPR